MTVPKPKCHEAGCWKPPTIHVRCTEHAVQRRAFQTDNKDHLMRVLWFLLDERDRLNASLIELRQVQQRTK